MCSSSRLAVLLTSIAAVSAGASTEAPHGLATSSRQPQFTTGTELVVLHVTVTDRRGYVPGLPETAFRIFEDDVPQRLRFFGGEDAPATVGLLVDASGSMREGRDRVVAAVTSFVADSHPQDEVFALAFNEHVVPVLPAEMPFVNDARTLQAALTRAIVARGRTALYDAVAAGLAEVARGHHARRALVLVADGGDNASTLGFDQLLRRAQSSNATIHAIGLLDPVDREASPRRLRALAAATGGTAHFPRGLDDVDEAFERIARDLRQGYTLGYVPDADAPDGRFRRLRVEVTPPDGRRVTVRTRAGYLAGGTRQGGAS